MQRTIEFVVVFWGAKYREFFTRFCLPSLLAPNNFGFFSRPEANGVSGRLIICSTQEDYVLASQDPLFELLAPHVETEFIDIGRQPKHVHAQIHMSQGHKLALYGIMKRKSFGSFLAPDIILSDGSIATLVRHVAAGARRILFPALRFDLNKCAAGLSEIGALEPGRPVAVAPRALARVAAASLHSELLRFDYDSDHFSDYPISTIFADPGKGLIVHTSSWGVVVDFSDLEHFDQRHFDEDTMDAHFIDEYIFGAPDLVLLSDTDEFFMLPLTSEEDMPLEHLLRPDPYLAGQSGDVVAARKSTYLRRFLFSAGSDAFKRWVVRTPVRIHYTDLNNDNDAVAARALCIVDRALHVNRLAKPVYFVVAFCGESARRRFVDVCLPSLLSPRNLPELAGIPGCRLLVGTTKADWDALSADGCFHILQSFVSAELIDIGKPDAGDLLPAQTSAVCGSAAARSVQDNAYLSILMPDTIMSDGTIARLIELANAGFDTVLTMAPRYQREAIERKLRQSGHLLPHKPMHVTPRELTRLSISCLHSEYRRCDWDGARFPARPDAIYLEAPGGCVMHSAQWALLLANFSPGSNATIASPGADTEFLSTIEDELCVSREAGKMYCVTDSDEINLISLKRDAASRMPPPRRSRPAPFWVKEATQTAHLAEYLEREQNKLGRILYRIGVQYHAHELTNVWRLVAKRTESIVENALAGSGAFAGPTRIAEPASTAFADSGMSGGFYSKLAYRIDALAYWIDALAYRIDALAYRLGPMWMVIGEFVRDHRFRASALKLAVKDPRWIIRRLRARTQGDQGVD